MTKKDEKVTPKPGPVLKGRKQGRGGVYVDGKRVGGTESVETKDLAHNRQGAGKEVTDG